MPKTLFEKIWEAHEVRRPEREGGTSLIYVDLHLVHEVTSAQAFESLRLAGRKVRRPDRTLATADHNVPTDPAERTALDAIADHLSRAQVQALERNCEQFGIPYYGMRSPRQGIVHVIGPELGLSQPGITIACGDSHTSTHGALGALAMPVGTSEVEHVLATQCLVQVKPKTMRIEAGARAGLIAPDDVTFTYVEGRPGAPSDYEAAVERWSSLHTDDGAQFDTEVTVDTSALSPQVTWGTNPGMVAPVTGRVPDPASLEGPADREAAERALVYMALEPGTAIEDSVLDRVFIGSCTNSRIEDLRAAAALVKGRSVASTVRAMVVPGSMQVKAQAEQEGLDAIFKGAGFEWREAGCSMCLGMNPDILQPGERCASTSNRNFEGRQGRGGRTHLVSPQMAAAAAIEGHFVDIRDWPA